MCLFVEYMEHKAYCARHGLRAVSYAFFLFRYIEAPTREGFKPTPEGYWRSL
jgi:hypothetical protein